MQPPAGIPQANPDPAAGAVPPTSESIVVSNNFVKGTKQRIDAYKEFKGFKQ